MKPIFEARKDELNKLRDLNEPQQKNATKEIPDDLFTLCKDCGQSTLTAGLKEQLYVCSHCGNHMGISGLERLESLFDKGIEEELNPNLYSTNPLQFPGYEEKLASNEEKTDISEAVITATGEIGTIGAVVAAFDSSFFMGSMGTVVGEKITRAIEYATKYRLPFISFTASGGARMQEGIFSLMQMAKTSAALARHDEEGLLYISCLTHPTTGGVTASFASLGDIILAEPNALIGFAGPRVIEQTIRTSLPQGFQRAEFMEKHGFVDRIVHRHQMKETLALLLKMHLSEVI